jgi:6-pyruvoyl-tetrahydropterin synthase
MKSTVWVTTEFVGYHCWPDAPNEVSFLRNLHRHLFKVRVEVENKADRSVEFFILQRDVKTILSVLPTHEGDVGEHRTMSCEGMAHFIHSNLNEKYNVSSVIVSEDGENGATVEW